MGCQRAEIEFQSQPDWLKRKQANYYKYFFSTVDKREIPATFFLSKLRDNKGCRVLGQLRI
jgi:hypothetical protein